MSKHDDIAALFTEDDPPPRTLRCPVCLTPGRFVAELLAPPHPVFLCQVCDCGSLPSDYGGRCGGLRELLPIVTWPPADPSFVFEFDDFGDGPHAGETDATGVG